MSPFLFMGVQEDPELDVVEARGGTRIYDGTDRYHADAKCGACGGPLEISRDAVCETCSAANRDASK